jgi:pre-60S factor REI1
MESNINPSIYPIGKEGPEPPSVIELTSTTAPGKIFSSRADLAAHYKTPWHKYNLKRREAGLPPLLETDFLARLSAAQAVHTERSTKKQKGAENVGKVHLKNGKTNKQIIGNDISPAITSFNNESHSSQEVGGDSNFQNAQNLIVPSIKAQKTLEINPKQCLFDRHVSATVQANVDRMHRKYGFFIPDYEYLTDMTGLIGYCHEKIQLGNLCLYCHRTFRTSRSCIQHMRNKVHTKLRYEIGIDLEDLDVFYDFTEANDAFFNSTIHPKLQGPTTVSDDDEQADEEKIDDDDQMDEENVDDDDEWDDVSDDDDNEDEGDEENYDEMDDDDDLYRGYEEEVARMGWKITPLGELIFPDGRIIGHRGLRRYYKQRLSQHKETSIAVSAAKQAAGERLYRGRVYNISHNGFDNESNELSRALTLVGISPGIATGRAGKGILVTSGGTFSQLSVYRYRAAVRKQRMQMRQGQQLVQRTKTNINRMDKKANRLMNNVSVAHAQR